MLKQVRIFAASAGLLLSGVLLSGLMPTGEAQAHTLQKGDPRNYSAGEARNARQDGQQISHFQAMAAARRVHPGAEVADVNQIGGAQPRFIVRMVYPYPDGRRVEVIVDARTGQVIRS